MKIKSARKIGICLGHFASLMFWIALLCYGIHYNHTIAITIAGVLIVIGTLISCIRDIKQEDKGIRIGTKI